MFISFVQSVNKAATNQQESVIVSGSKNVQSNEQGIIQFGFTTTGANKQSLFSRMSPTNRVGGGPDGKTIARTQASTQNI